VLLGASEPPTCPGLDKPFVSPNGRWSIECQPKPDNELDQPHKIVLRDQRKGTREELRSFDRWATLFWAPACDRIAVTDGEASGVANSFVYTPGKPTAVQDVFDLLRQQVAASRLAFLEGKDHVYLEVIKSVDNEHLKIRLSGHGGGVNFKREFTVLIPRVRD
jgi:hypothetical protein